MPLRDHYHPPLSIRRSWEGFHGGWPAMIVIELNRKLAQRYYAEPRVHLGSSMPALSASSDLPKQYEYEVRVCDEEAGCRLVTAVEIVSPANKDRPGHRRAFVAKCAALLQNEVCVAIVDPVTTWTSNLYNELMELLGHSEAASADGSPALYAVCCRPARKEGKGRLETWMYPLAISQPFPTLPLWLAENLAVPLELEPTYEETCRSLRIP
jgi:hypothetical protein